MSFEKELEGLINKHSKENESNTPDFILAQYVSACLAAFSTATQQRETWYGRDARPTHNTPLNGDGGKLCHCKPPLYLWGGTHCGKCYKEIPAH